MQAEREQGRTSRPEAQHTPDRRRHEHASTGPIEEQAPSVQSIVGRIAELQRLVGNAAIATALQSETDKIAADQVRSVVKSSGAPLDASFRSMAESFLGSDLRHVRVHTDEAASRSAAAMRADAYTSGADVVFGAGKYDTRSTAGQHRLIHELTHVVQQSRGPIDGTVTSGGLKLSDPSDRFEREADRMGAAFVTGEAQAGFTHGHPTVRAPHTGSHIASPSEVQRDGNAADSKSTAVRASDYKDVLDSMMPADIDARVDRSRAHILAYLTHGLGVGGASFTRSSEVRQFRAVMKQAGRAKAADDIEATLATNTKLGAASKEYIRILARHSAYSEVKDSVDTALSAKADEWLTDNWDAAAIGSRARAAARAAAWGVLETAIGRYPLGEPPTVSKAAHKNAAAAALSAAKQSVDDQQNRIKSEARGWKNSFIKPANDLLSKVKAGSATQGLADDVTEQVGSDKVGESVVEAVITAETAEAGIGKIGKLLDQVIPTAGDHVALAIELKIPVPHSPAYVSVGFSGKAGRGIDGYTTAGVTTLGDPRRLEVMGEFKLGAGVAAPGVKGGANVKFFVRGGADSTANCMKAVSYGSYRAASGINHNFGNWWAGSGEGTGRDGSSAMSKTQRAETWAAAMEEQVFAEEEGAFADVGGSLGAELDVNFGVAKASVADGVAAFKRYNKAALKKSLGNKFARPVLDKDTAQERRDNVRGATGAAWSASASASHEFAGTGVTFSVSASGPIGKPDFGVNISASISHAGTDTNTTQIENIAAGIVSGALGAVKNLIAALEHKKVGPMADLGADVLQIRDAGMQGQISHSLAQLWSTPGSKFDSTSIQDAFKGKVTTPDPGSGVATSSTLEVVIIFGRSGGKGVFRVELRQAKKVAVSAEIGNVGLTASFERGKRLAAFGYEDGKWNAEGLGVRARDADAVSA